MNTEQAYNTWAATYDTAENPTRDLEARAIRSLIPPGPYTEVIELGCGTGKNTEWLALRAERLIAVDFSAEMMQQAQQKSSLHVTFQHADITKHWQFANAEAELLTCSLILEHVQDLGHIFSQAWQALRPGALFYIGELHPFKQYQGSKARFNVAEDEVFELECYVHHISDFTENARQQGFRCLRLQEWFDEGIQGKTPQVVSFLFQKGG